MAEFKLYDVASAWQQTPEWQEYDENTRRRKLARLFDEFEPDELKAEETETRGVVMNKFVEDFIGPQSELAHPEVPEEEGPPSFFEEAYKANRRAIPEIVGRTGGILTQVAGESIKSLLASPDFDLPNKVGDFISKEGREATKYWTEISAEYAPHSDFQGKNLVDDPQLLVNPAYMIGGFSDAVYSLAPVIAASAAGGPVAGLVVGGMLEAAPVYEEMRQEGLSHEEALVPFLAVVGVIGALETIGAGSILKLGAKSKGLTGKIAKQIAEATGGVTKKIKNKTAREIVEDIGEGFIPEGLEEAAEELFIGAISEAAIINSKVEGDWSKLTPEMIDGFHERMVDSMKAGVTVFPSAGAAGGLMRRGRRMLSDRQKAATKVVYNTKEEAQALIDNDPDLKGKFTAEQQKDGTWAPAPIPLTAEEKTDLTLIALQDGEVTPENIKAWAEERGVAEAEWKAALAMHDPITEAVMDVDEDLEQLDKYGRLLESSVPEEFVGPLPEYTSDFVGPVPGPKPRQGILGLAMEQVDEKPSGRMYQQTLPGVDPRALNRQAPEQGELPFEEAEREAFMRGMRTATQENLPGIKTQPVQQELDFSEPTREYNPRNEKQPQLPLGRWGEKFPQKTTQKTTRKPVQESLPFPEETPVREETVKTEPPVQQNLPFEKVLPTKATAQAYLKGKVKRGEVPEDTEVIKTDEGWTIAPPESTTAVDQEAVNTTETTEAKVASEPSSTITEGIDKTEPKSEEITPVAGKPTIDDVTPGFTAEDQAMMEAEEAGPDAVNKLRAKQVKQGTKEVPSKSSQTSSEAPGTRVWDIDAGSNDTASSLITKDVDAQLEKDWGETWRLLKTRGAKGSRGGVVISGSVEEAYETIRALQKKQGLKLTAMPTAEDKESTLGVYIPNLRMSFLMGDNMTPEKASGVIMHEMAVHAVPSKQMDARAKSLYNKYKNEKFMQQVKTRLVRFNHMTPEGEVLHVEELRAIMVEEAVRGARKLGLRTVDSKFWKWAEGNLPEGVVKFLRDLASYLPTRKGMKHELQSLVDINRNVLKDVARHGLKDPGAYGRLSQTAKTRVVNRVLNVGNSLDKGTSYGEAEALQSKDLSSLQPVAKQLTNHIRQTRGKILPAHRDFLSQYKVQEWLEEQSKIDARFFHLVDVKAAYQNVEERKKKLKEERKALAGIPESLEAERQRRKIEDFEHLLKVAQERRWGDVVDALATEFKAQAPDNVYKIDPGAVPGSLVEAYGKPDQIPVKDLNKEIADLQKRISEDTTGNVENERIRLATLREQYQTRDQIAKAMTDVRRDGIDRLKNRGLWGINDATDSALLAMFMRYNFSYGKSGVIRRKITASSMTVGSRTPAVVMDKARQIYQGSSEDTSVEEAYVQAMEEFFDEDGRQQIYDNAGVPYDGWYKFEQGGVDTNDWSNFDDIAFREDWMDVARENILANTVEDSRKWYTMEGWRDSNGEPFGINGYDSEAEAEARLAEMEEEQGEDFDPDLEVVYDEAAGVYHILDTGEFNQETFYYEHETGEAIGNEEDFDQWVWDNVDDELEFMRQDMVDYNPERLEDYFPNREGSSADDLHAVAGCTLGGWCTGEDEGAAHTQLAGGDFWIYSEDAWAKIAIRMDGTDEVGEISGSLDGQYLADDEVEVLKNFINDDDRAADFSDGARDLTAILNDQKNAQLAIEWLEDTSQKVPFPFDYSMGRFWQPREHSRYNAPLPLIQNPQIRTRIEAALKKELLSKKTVDVFGKEYTVIALDNDRIGTVRHLVVPLPPDPEFKNSLIQGKWTLARGIGSIYDDTTETGGSVHAEYGETLIFEKIKSIDFLELMRGGNVYITSPQVDITHILNIRGFEYEDGKILDTRVVVNDIVVKDGADLTIRENGASIVIKGNLKAARVSIKDGGVLKINSIPAVKRLEVANRGKVIVGEKEYSEELGNRDEIKRIAAERYKKLYRGHERAEFIKDHLVRGEEIIPVSSGFPSVSWRDGVRWLVKEGYEVPRFPMRINPHKVFDEWVMWGKEIEAASEPMKEWIESRREQLGSNLVGRGFANPATQLAPLELRSRRLELALQKKLSDKERGELEERYKKRVAELQEKQGGDVDPLEILGMGEEERIQTDLAWETEGNLHRENAQRPTTEGDDSEPLRSSEMPKGKLRMVARNEIGNRAEALAEVSREKDAILKKLERGGLLDDDKVLDLLSKYKDEIQTLKDDKVDIHEKQTTLEYIIKDMMPLEDRGRVINFIRGISKPKTARGRTTALNRAISKVIAEAERQEKRKGLKRIKDMMADALKTKATASNLPRASMDDKALTILQHANQALIAGHEAYEKAVKDWEQVLKRVDTFSSNDLNDLDTEAFYENTKVTMRITFSGLDQRSASDVANAEKALEAILARGKADLNKTLEEHKAKIEETREKVIKAVSGGKGFIKDSRVWETLQRKRAKHKRIREKITNPFRSFDDNTASWEMLLDKIEGKTPTDEALQGEFTKEWRKLAMDATVGEQAGMMSYKRVLLTKGMEFFKAKNKRQLASIMLKNSTCPTNTGLTIKGENDTRVAIDLSQNEAYGIWQKYQQPSLAKTLERDGYDEITFKQLNRYLTDEVKAWAQWQVDTFYPNYYDSVNEKFMAIYHVPIPRVDGYTPTARERIGKENEPFIQSPFMVTSVAGSALHLRTETHLPLKVVDGDSMLLRHITEMEHFKAWGGMVRQARQVFGSKDVRMAIEQHHGSSAYHVLMGFVDDFARGGIDKANALSVLDHMRANFTRAVIGANPVVFLKQLSSIPAYMMDIPMHHFVSGTISFWRNPVKNYKTLMSSPLMKARYSMGHERDVQLMMMMSKNNIGTSTRADVTDALMATTKLGDRMAIILGGWSVYKYHRDVKKASHEEAIREFETATVRSQQSANLMDMSAFQRHPGSAHRWMTMFITSPTAYYRNTSIGVRNLKRRRGRALGNVKRVGVSWFLLPMLFQYAASGFEWDDEAMKRAAFVGPLNGLFVARDFIEPAATAIFEKRVYPGVGVSPPMTVAEKNAEMLLSAVNVYEKGWNEEDATVLLEDFIVLLGMATGFPGGPALRMIEGWWLSPNDKYPILSRMGYGKWALERKEELRKERNYIEGF